MKTVYGTWHGTQWVTSSAGTNSGFNFMINFVFGDSKKCDDHLLLCFTVEATIIQQNFGVVTGLVILLGNGLVALIYKVMMVRFCYCYKLGACFQNFHKFFKYAGNANEQAMPIIGNQPAAFQSAEGPITPGAFASGGPVRGDGAIPGVGMAMPLVQSSMESGVAVDSSRQQTTFAAMPPGLIPPRVPHPPSAPYPSMMASNQPILQQAQVQSLHQALQQQPLISIQQPQQLQQMQMLPPPPPLPPPRPMAPPVPQHPPLPPGAAPTSVPSEPLLSRPGLSQSSAPLVMSGQMPSMIQMQGLTSQLQPQIGSAPAVGIPSMQPLPMPQFQGSGGGGEFVASGGMQSGGMPMSGGQQYIANVGVQGHPPSMMPPSYSNLQAPVPNMIPPTPDAYSVSTFS